MKTKIIYISGDEIFDIADIRAAFEEVRGALNLSKDTVLFGVPVDSEDAGLATNTNETVDNIQQDIVAKESVIETQEIKDSNETVEETNSDHIVEIEPAPKKTTKRTRSRKHEKVEENEVIEDSEKESENEKVVPILSVLSVNDDESEVVATENDEIVEDVVEEQDVSQTEILTDEEEQQIADTIDDSEEIPEAESDLEQLLSAMKPLAEDSSDEIPDIQNTKETVEETDNENIDATLEQLATEFVKNQDKISSDNKNSTRSKIGKLRNILPFKQSKHKDQGLGDLFGWAGIAANDEDFSVPGFFTNASSRK